MAHGDTLITTIAAALVLAFVCGALANRLRLPPLVGYLVAGVLVGPHTPGFVADQALAPQLAEIGVVLLMFGVGLSFSARDLVAVRGIAVPAALVQMALGGAFGWALGVALGWPWGGSVVFGMAISVASTVVMLKWLQDRHLVESGLGKIAIGWLIVEDIVMVLALVLIPAAVDLAAGAETARGPLMREAARLLGWQPGLGLIAAVTVAKIAVFIALMLVVGRRLVPALLHRVAHGGSRELFRLAVLATALGIAFGAAEMFGVSLALGAFFAGVVLAESPLSVRAAQESLPLRDAFAVLFFVSVGMLFDPASLIADPLPMAATVAIIVLVRPVIAFWLVRGFGHPVATAVTLAGARAQIGEFSFILAELGLGLGLLPAAAQDLIIGGALISIVLNPFIVRLGELAAPALERRLAGAPAVAPEAAPEAAEAAAEATAEAPAPAEPAASAQSGHTVLVGYGRVGEAIAEALERAGTAYLVLEAGDAAVAGLRERGIEAFAGNAADPRVLGLANLGEAKVLVMAIPDAFEAGQIAEQARRANPALRIMGRAHSRAEAEHLAGCGADLVILAEREVARGMTERLGLRAAERPEAALEAAEAGEEAKPGSGETPPDRRIPGAADAEAGP